MNMSVERMSESERTATVKPATPIPSAFQGLMNSISDLDNSLRRLFERIEPALGPNYPVPADPTDAAKSPEETSELAKALQYEGFRVQELNAVVHNIINRIEL